MKFVPIDQRLDLFQIELPFPNWFLKLILSPDRLLSYDYEMYNTEDKQHRRNVHTPFTTFWSVNYFAKRFEKKISNFLKFPITLSSWEITIDEPNFSMSKHIDCKGETDNFGLHIYLNDLDCNVGTCFYDGDKLRHQFKFVKNTGYLMLNNENQVHSAHVPVPENCYRASIHFWFVKNSLSKTK